MLVPIAEGFEEIEAVTIVDVLRRGDVDVVLAGVSTDAVITGSHGIRVHVDAQLAEVRDESFDMLILPGGEPGVTHLGASPTLQDVISRQLDAGRPLGAICAAPRILSERGDLSGRRATSHPSVEANLRDGGALYEESRRVVRDGDIITSRGPGTAIEFALEALRLLGHGAHAERLASAMLLAASS